MDYVWESCESFGGIVVTRAPVKTKTPVSLADTGSPDKRVKGLEPSTFTLATPPENTPKSTENRLFVGV